MNKQLLLDIRELVESYLKDLDEYLENNLQGSFQRIRSISGYINNGGSIYKHGLTDFKSIIYSLSFTRYTLDSEPDEYIEIYRSGRPKEMEYILIENNIYNIFKELLYQENVDIAIYEESYYGETIYTKAIDLIKFLENNKFNLNEFKLLLI